MSTWSQETVQDAVKKAIGKAAIDEKFRALCNSNIHAAIKEVSGKEVPASIKINVVDNTGFHISVTLPPLQKADGELGDSELESVAGGKGNIIPNGSGGNSGIHFGHIPRDDFPPPFITHNKLKTSPGK